MSSAWVPDYAFYQGEYGGRLGEAAFYAQLPAATAHVDWLIGWNEVDCETAEAYKRAVCAAVDAVSAFGGEWSGGFTIGSFSASAPSQGGTAQDAMTASAVKELATSGLLYQGVW